MFIDADRIPVGRETTEFYALNRDTNQLTVTLPHRRHHVEPALGLDQILEGFLARGREDESLSADAESWALDEALSFPSGTSPVTEGEPMSTYLKLINWLVLVKL